MTLNSLPAGISVSGSQGYYGGNLTLPSTASSNFTNWSNGGTLTLSAVNSVFILAPISVSNANSGVAIKTSQGTAAGSNVGYYKFGLSESGFSGRIDFSGATGQTFTTQDGTNASNLKNYTFITSLAELGASNLSLSGHYALRSDINAATYLQPGVVSFNGGNGVGDPYPYSSVRAGNFSGTFAGLGHTISNLQIKGTSTNAGLFHQLHSAVVQDVRFDNAAVTGRDIDSLAVLAGYANNATVTGILVNNSSVTMSNSGSWTAGVLGYTEGGVLRDAWVVNTPSRALQVQRVWRAVRSWRWTMFTTSAATSTVRGAMRSAACLDASGTPRALVCPTPTRPPM
jgi:hypothetical protein